MVPFIWRAGQLSLAMPCQTKSARWGLIVRFFHPSADFKNIKVYFTPRLTSRVVKAGYDGVIFPLAKFKIRKEEINKDPGKYVFCIRASMQFDLENMPGIDNGNLIYSLWDGYLKKGYTKSFVDYLKGRSYSLHQIHTSGHADIPTLKEFVNALQPKTIIPIHTFAKAQYKNIFQYPVLELTDGEVQEV